jgi:glucose-6-phosphate 1-dehydrogenase
MRYLLLGATGDLARSRIAPALARLGEEGALPPDFEFVASSRRPWGDAEYRAFIAPGAPESFLARTHYLPADFNDAGSLERLREAVRRADALQLAISPAEYARVIESLGGSLASSKLLIEKPFGFDGPSARELDTLLTRFMPEEKIFRVDHYLGKESVRALANKARGARRIELYLEERRDLAGRGAFYDQVGVVRDVVQNHALAALAIALDENDRARVLEELVYSEGSLRLGQYEGYEAEPGVAPGSSTPTAARLAFSYRDAAIEIHAAKALARDRSALVIDGVEHPLAGGRAYENLIADALAGRREWFPTLDEILAAWRLVDPLLAAQPALPLASYPPGSADF